MTRYNMTREQNVFVAKRNIVDYIWKSANLEGIPVTFPETDAIFNGANVARLDIRAIITINNLKHAWSFVLDNIDHQFNYPMLCKINQEIGAGGLIYGAGEMRKMPVNMTGTKWKPDAILFEYDIKDKISKIMAIPEPTERALELMAYCMRKQIFIDGNKRTAMLAANHTMIANGAGVISVPVELNKEFGEHLTAFYETNDARKIKLFIHDKCIDGLNFNSSGDSTPSAEHGLKNKNARLAAQYDFADPVAAAGAAREITSARKDKPQTKTIKPKKHNKNNGK